MENHAEGRGMHGGPFRDHGSSTGDPPRRNAAVLSDLRREKDGKRHVSYLVLQFLDAVDMSVLVLEDIFQDLPGGEIAYLSG